MIELVATKCCGLREINNLAHAPLPEDALNGIKKALQLGYDNWGTRHPVPFVVFTAVTERMVKDHASGREDDYGQTFADFLVANGLGVVTRSEERENWTRNMIRVWVWCPNYPELWKWYDAREPKVGGM